MSNTRKVDVTKHREIRVKAVTRYVITDYARESDERDWTRSGGRLMGEFDNPIQANEVGAALAHNIGALFTPVHDSSWTLPREKWSGDQHIFYPEPGSPAARAKVTVYGTVTVGGIAANTVTASTLAGDHKPEDPESVA